MKRVKACLNHECTEYKKTYYKEKDEYCIKCGAKLNFVCKHKNCFKQLPDDMQDAYCPSHLAERKDRQEKNIGRAAKVGVGATATALTVLTAGKLITQLVRKK